MTFHPKPPSTFPPVFWAFLVDPHNIMEYDGPTSDTIFLQNKKSSSTRDPIGRPGSRFELIHVELEDIPGQTYGRDNVHCVP